MAFNTRGGCPRCLDLDFYPGSQVCHKCTRSIALSALSFDLTIDYNAKNMPKTIAYMKIISYLAYEKRAKCRLSAPLLYHKSINFFEEDQKNYTEVPVFLPFVPFIRGLRCPPPAIRLLLPRCFGGFCGVSLIYTLCSQLNNSGVICNALS